MSITLGLNCNHADSSACIIKNGKLLFAIEEERINRIKHWAGLPASSINACLENSNIKIEEITDITLNTNPFSNLSPKISYFLKNYLFGKKKYEVAKRIKNKLNIKNDLNNFFYPKKLSKNIKIHYIDHHISHIASAFFPSKFEKAVGLSIDGFGDFCSIAIAKCEQQNIKIIDRVFFPDSLGVFYESFTQFIGFKNYGDEYKIMGLSSYGNPKYYDQILSNIFDKKDQIKLNLKYFNHSKSNYSYKFSGKPNQDDLLNHNIHDLLNKKEPSKNNQITQFQKDVASSVQKVFEEKLIQIIKKIKNLNFSENLVYAGGCALNSLANKKLYDSKLFKNIFIPYAPGDGGGSIGSALFYLKKKNNKIIFSNINSPFIGPKYKNSDIKKELVNNIELKKFNIKYEEDNKILNQIIANEIFKNKIIGYFNDRMEFGARALGNRSILANPCNPNIREIINSKIKKRESFRPFAPAIMSEKKFDWFSNHIDNPYMSTVEEIKKEKRKFIPAVTHVDGTGRVQTVSKEMSPNFHSLISEFYQISKVPILLNTSFNENEPIVMNYKDAINCFLRTNMDILVLNNFIITR